MSIINLHKDIDLVKSHTEVQVFVAEGSLFEKRTCSRDLYI